ncbi:TonB-dependent receptor [Olivibacter sp. SDN3]|uniref:TonB-dependent receptor n=1 Tax=Olivibacter sp. SDN3 TaxID=2764720 RepID=UPI0016511414|nr:TonB-dependent receptor [Olivibacter sp. SDN3]QNL49957.1 TonB-dependent receptor [Olivibacter sp. SDN3]
MKLIVVWVLLFSFAAHANLKAQKISINVKELPLPDFLEVVKKQTGIRFIYDSDIMRSSKPVSIQVADMDFLKVLDRVLAEQSLSYKKIAGTVALRKKTTITLVEKAEQQETITVTGTITDSTGAVLPGVSIRVKGEQRGTTTNEEGKYVIDVLENAILSISYVGYKSKEVFVDKETLINIELQADASSLEEVVVVGFGVQKKLTSIGAQSTVRPTELKTPVRNLSTVLAGRLSGIVGVQRSGEPGYDNANIFIRGQASLSGSSAPLVLVDGVERPFQDIDPEDIESFSILKDASATAVYGVRGANGVILINTRKGAVQKTKVVAGYNEGISDFVRVPQFVDGPTYMSLTNEALTNRGRSAAYTAEEIELTRTGIDPDLYPNVNWMNELFEDFGRNRRFNLNMTGGSERANFYVSAAYFNEVGLFKRDELQRYNSKMALDRYNFTANLSMQATPTTKVDLGVQGFILDGNYPGAGTENIFGRTMDITPVLFPLRYTNGALAEARVDAGGPNSLSNPYTMLTQTGFAKHVRNRVNSNIRATQDFNFITPGLTAYAMFAFDYYNSTTMRRHRVPDTYYATERNEAGELILQQTNVGSPYLSFERTGNEMERRFYTEAAINYVRSFDKHNVTGMFLFNQSDFINSIANDFINSLPYRYRGFAGRGTYDFDNRYLLELNFGFNGSENFLPERRYGFFPSLGLGWVLSEESFFKSLKGFVPLAKFRFSHGVVGNADIGGRRFAYIGTVGEGSGGYQFGETYNRHFDGTDFEEYAVDVTWERSTKTNLGIDFDIFKGDLNVQFDLFRELRDGSFLRRSAVPAFVGLINNPYGNLGRTENKGFDASMTYRKDLSNSFSLNFQPTITYNRTTVIEDDLPLWNYPWRERKGQQIGQRFGYIAEGFFTSEEEIQNSATQVGDTRPGDLKYVDLNGDGLIDANDEAPIGYGSFPRLVYGMRFGFNYKRFSVAAFFQGIGDVDILLNGVGFAPFQRGGSEGNVFTLVNEDRWTVENPNPNAFYPRLSFGDENMNYRTSSHWVRNGAFLRLKTVDVNYTFNPKLVEKLRLSSATIFFQGFNLLTFSDFDLWDVELGDGRGAIYPQQKIYSLGLQVTF